MAEIKIEQIQEYAEKLKSWLLLGESPAKECLVIQFKKGNSNIVIDDEMVNKTLYFQSRNGNISIEFDSTGLINNIEIS
ncbi:hypothetical protein ACFLYH_02970 [Candidatus Dependentiae bacterium]